MLLTKNPETGYFTEFESGDYLTNVHDPRDCADREIGCAIHDRASNHPLANAPLNWREDAGKLERICEHGVGHDDYDSTRWTLHAFPNAQYVGVHGCCVTRCCSPKTIVVKIEENN